MKKLLSLVIAIFLGSALLSSSAFADVAKGQKLYLKFLKGKTGMNGAKFAALHSQDEWEEMFEESGFEDEYGAKYGLDKFFGGAKWGKMRSHVKDFVIEYANDSGNVPSC